MFIAVIDTVHLQLEKLQSQVNPLQIHPSFPYPQTYSQSMLV